MHVHSLKFRSMLIDVRLYIISRLDCEMEGIWFDSLSILICKSLFRWFAFTDGENDGNTCLQ